MRGKKEEVLRGARQGTAGTDDLQLLKFILDEHPRLKERVIRYIESKRVKFSDEIKKGKK